MKLQLKAKYGQREAAWASIILGYNAPSSPYTIGMYGCLITSLGNYVGKNPIDVNQILKDNGGFTEKSGNFIWSKSTVLGLAQVYASPKYVGPVTSQGIAKMKSLLDEGRPLLTHIDFDPKDPDDDQHWLMVTGYDGDTFFAFDPWSKSDITLDVYGGVTRAVLEFKAYDVILPKESATMSILIADFERIRGNSEKWDKTHAYLGLEGDPAYTPFEDIQRVIAGIRSRATDMESQARKWETECGNRVEQVGRLKAEIIRIEALNKDVNNKLNTAIKNLNEIGGLHEANIKTLQGQINTLATEKGALNIKIAELEAKKDFEILIKAELLGGKYELIRLK